MRMNPLDVFAEGYVESCEVQNFEMLTTGQISILCPDIYWYSTTSVMAYYSQITGAFTFSFPTESNPEPFILGKYNTQNMMTIVNDGDEIPVSAYWYSYATTPDEAKLEAEVCVSILKGKQFEFPIFFDQEEKTTLDTGKANCSEMIRAFCDVLEANGYWVGLYTSRSCLTTHIEDDIKKRYALWAAEWSDKLRYDGPVGIWQHSEKGKVDGITGNVDLDIGYKDYPTIIKAKGLNGYGKAPDPTPAPTVNDSISVEVTVDGKKYSGKLNKS